MERTVKDLLDEYRRADFNKRLDFYLQYNELRGEFIEIDRKELRSDSLGVRERSKRFPVIRVIDLFSLAAWRMKRILGIA